MPRFVVLTHDHPFLHWDLMIEEPVVESLRTWRLLDVPDSRGGSPVERLADHRLEYLDYEGAVSGDRGSVARWDSGEYKLIQETSTCIVLELRGQRLSGVYRIASDSASPADKITALTWRFTPDDS